MSIVLSLTTIPDRMNFRGDHSTTKICLDNLLNQTYPEYEIHLNIPREYMGKIVNIPEWVHSYVNKYKNLKIFTVDDYGPVTKLLPTLQRISDPDCIIIIVDDDLYYNTDMLNYHISIRNKYPNSAIGFAGITAINGSCHFCTSLSKDTRVKMLEGYKTVSFLRKFFEVEDFIENFATKTWNDDVAISAYLGYRNIEKIVVSYDKDTDFSPRVESFPVIGHIPTERSGCSNFRSSKLSVEVNDNMANEWYRLGYLER